MQAIHEYPGPSAEDYAEVTALNAAFIRQSHDLKGPQLGRLSTAPFLLFSLRESDFEWWSRTLSDNGQQDLLEPAEPLAPDMRRLQVAALSFLWHLSRRNPYAVRIITGAPQRWCDMIASLPLVVFLERAGGVGGLLKSRLDESALSGQRLLDGGTSAKRELRRSSKICVFQSLLNSIEPEIRPRNAAAACSLSGPLRSLRKKL